MVSPILQVNHLTKKFGGLTANHDISFSVSEREILSVIGPNGAGKSTLFKLISSFLPTTSGEVLFDGERVSNLALTSLQEKALFAHFRRPQFLKI